MKIQFSCDDGHETDLQISKMFKDRGLSCIFYVPTNMVQIDQNDYRIVHPKGGHHLYLKELQELAKDFEIGGHI